MSSSIRGPSPVRNTDVEMLDDSMNFGIEVEAACQSVLDDTLSIIEDVEQVVEKLINDVAEGRIPKVVRFWKFLKIYLY